ncbi:hypothetical protein LOD99_9675 [Oopsacas minuta]|uniref:Uncharacterized protein n=1 Tax=Oopsacas minuta TaxID=111878 RepID=A0AAV7KL39_9METZ|nr:hypothetical protein LOD99_9675 [Oopsacas minuta]
MVDNIRDDFTIQEGKEYNVTPRDRKTSLSKVRASMLNAHDAINTQTAKLSRYRKTFRIIYTLVLIFTIAVIWISLIGPLVVGFLSRPSLDNLQRPNVAILNSSLARNPKYLPPKCVTNGTNTTNNYSINCPIDYVFNCTMCVPICGLWHPSGSSYYIGYRVTTIIAAVVDFLFSVFGLIILLRVPGTFRFPQINYVFMFINAVIFSMVLMSAALPGPFYFFCEQRLEDYAIVSQEPAIYLTIIGIVAHISYFSFNIWFLCATVNVFIIVYFPSWQILQSRKHKITLFIIECGVSFGIPPLFPIIYLALYKEYTFIRLPQIPFIVEPLPALVFIIFPLLIFTALSLTIISLTLYKLQLQKLIVMADRQKIQLKSFEIRLIIFAISLGVVVFVVFLEISFDVRYSIILQFTLEEFWSCLTLENNFDLFHVSNLTCPMDYTAYSLPIFTYIGDMGLGVWSILLLVILTTKETRNAWTTLFNKLCRNPVTTVISHSKFHIPSKIESVHTTHVHDVIK